MTIWATKHPPGGSSDDYIWVNEKFLRLQYFQMPTIDLPSVPRQLPSKNHSIMMLVAFIEFFLFFLTNLPLLLI